MKSTQRFVVRDSSQVAEARRSVVSIAQKMGFGETDSGKVALVVTEAATNLLKHGGGGELLVNEIGDGGTRSLDILALDKGSGMADVTRCFEDGFSTVGSPGTGLGAMRRLSSDCRIYSRLAKGAVVLCRFLSKNGRTPSAPFDSPSFAVSGVSVAMKGESECGDGWAFEQAGDIATLLVADGLGHGLLAAAASVKAIELFRKYASLSPADLLGRIHEALRSTRGAAAGIARLNRVQRTVTFAGIGNIAGTVAFPGGARQMVCLAGIVGHEARSLREFVYDWPAGALVALASDGLLTQWSLRAYEEILGEDPALIAGVLYRDFNRPHDDATVVVVAESGAFSMNRILAVEIQNQHGVVAARQRAREIAALLGFDAQDQTRIATAVSEIARNAHEYGGGGTAQFFIEGASPPQSLLIRIADRGRGISNLQDILDGNYQSQTGMGMGISGSRRLVDRFEIESQPGSGTTVSLFKVLPAARRRLNARDLAKIAEELTSRKPRTAVEELETQNRELFSTLDQLRKRSDELARVNHELEDTNRGVLALYAELDEKANHLRRADESKSRFLSNMSHEFRTPVNSTVSICRMLLDRSDGDLTAEQELQVGLMLRAQEGLADLVNDLLDLAKVEAGKTNVTPGDFAVAELFSALRGMFRPLLSSPNVSLVFEDPAGVPRMLTDEGKISQILRNFISNSLKFTEQGEVRVSARFDAGTDHVVLTVTDSGIGISMQDQARIFEEFGQVDNRLQRKVKGTGLGLPLSRKLCELLGGAVSLESEPGQGSAFSARVPRVYPGLKQLLAEAAAVPPLDELKFPVLAVEDSVETILLYEKHLKRSAFQLIPVRTVAAARKMLGELHPAVILLDTLPSGEDPLAFLVQLKQDPAVRDIPVLVAAIAGQDPPLPGADGYCVKPVDRKSLLAALSSLTSPQPPETVLLIDDEEISRYVVAQFLAETRYTVTEAADGKEGIRRARMERPQAIFLDVTMPGMSGFEVLRSLKNEPETREIPVIIHTAKALTEEELTLLRQDSVAILSKGDAPGQTAGRIRQLLMMHTGNRRHETRN